MSIVFKSGIFILVILLSGCIKSPRYDTLKIGEISELKEKTPSTNDTYDLSLTAEKVEESRCPKGAECIWAGTATVSFRLITKQGTYNFDLDTNEESRFIQDTVIENFRYKLVDVKPYPEVNKVINQKYIYVRVTKE